MAPAPVPVARLFAGGYHGSEALSRGLLQMVGPLLDWGAGGTDRQLSKMRDPKRLGGLGGPDP
jgi:hypothetical protein